MNKRQTARAGIARAFMAVKGHAFAPEDAGACASSGRDTGIYKNRKGYSDEHGEAAGIPRTHKRTASAQTGTITLCVTSLYRSVVLSVFKA